MPIGFAANSGEVRMNSLDSSQGKDALTVEFDE